MILIAIANISNGKESIGFRLLDVESKQTKDVPIENIMQVIQSGKATLSNLKVENNKIVGSNGSIERLPKLVNKQLVGDSPLIIINQIGDIGYEVSDFKGIISNVKNTDLIKYASTNGISNGKIVNKEGKEFISAINGKYTTKNLEQTTEEQYYGELISNGKKLLPVISAINSSSFSNSRNAIAYYKDGKTNINRMGKVENIELGLDTNNLKKDLVYECDGYTIFGCLNQRVSMKNKKDKQEIAKLLQLETFRSSIDESIKNKTASGCNTDKETGLYIPKGDKTYGHIQVKKYIDIETGNTNISNDTLYKYLRYLSIMQVQVYVQHIVKSKGNIALTRKCSAAGISYETYKLDDMYSGEMKTITLEDIY